MGPFDLRRSTAWTALLVVLAVLPFAALPAKAMGVVGAASAADDATACGDACPMMEASRRSSHPMPMTCHRPASRDGGGEAPVEMECCAAPAPPAVPFDAATPSPIQVVDAPAPAPQPAPPVPPVRVVVHHDSGPPLPPGPALYTLHSSLLN